MYNKNMNCQLTVTNKKNTLLRLGRLMYCYFSGRTKYRLYTGRTKKLWTMKTTLKK